MNSFLYLDEYKMYSISAQIFGGLTESIVEYFNRDKGESETQKGPVGSGKILADIVTEQSGKQERRFLHDYAYTLFEKKLIEEEKLLELEDPLAPEFEALIRSASFVKVTGKALFTDVPQLVDLLKQFNSIGEALAYLQNFSQITDAKDIAEREIAKSSDRNRKAKLHHQMGALLDVKKLAKESGLHQDQKFLDHLSYLLRYMVKDEFEIQLTLKTADGLPFSFQSPLNTASLRESCSSIIRKYSRQCDEPLTLLGTITQGKKKRQAAASDETDQEPSTKENFRAALIKLVNATAGVEESFFGRLDNEYVMDPIAVFRQL